MSRRIQPHPLAQTTRSPSLRPSRHRRRSNRRRLFPVATGDDGGPASSSPANADQLTNDTIPSHPAWPAACASLLLGMATTMFVVGLLTRFANTPGGKVDATGVVVGGALVALAIGVRVPQQFAMWVCALAWHRFVARGRPTQMSTVLLNPAAAERPLYWVVLSVIVLGAGIATALTPISVRIALAVLEWMHGHFLWSGASVLVLHGSVVFLTGAIPLAALGLSMSLVHRLSCPFGGWRTSATGWLLIGGAGGLLASHAIGSARGVPNLMVVAAALPALIVSLVSAVWGSSRVADRPAGADSAAPPLPLWTDQRPSLLRAGIVGVGGIGAATAAIWVGLLSSGEGDSLCAAVMLAALGAGLLGGCHMGRSGARSIGGFGMACLGAGLVAALGSLGLTHLLSPGQSAAWAVACVTLVAVGLAISYGRLTLLSRVARQSSTGAKTLTRLFGYGALAVAVAEPLCTSLLGEAAALATLALLLLVLGGTLIAHEPHCSARTTRLRLGAVFATIALTIAGVMSL